MADSLCMLSDSELIVLWLFAIAKMRPDYSITAPQAETTIVSEEELRDSPNHLRKCELLEAERRFRDIGGC